MKTHYSMGSVKHGVLIGITAGLVVTCVEGLYLALPNMQIAPLYPAFLMGFNLIIWTALGAIAGFLTGRTTGALRRKSLSWYYGCFFLLPFALLYGILGRIAIPVGAWFTMPKMNPADGHLSFLIVVALVIFCLYAYRKEDCSAGIPKRLFVFEIAAIALLYHFCTNLSSLARDLFDQRLIFRLSPGLFSVIYCSGIVLIFALYTAMCRLQTYLGRTHRLPAPLTAIALLTVVSAAVLVSAAAAGFRESRMPIAHVVTTSEVAGEPQKIILLVLDTVRAESMSIYGGRARTDNLEAFARDAVVFDNCIAPSSWTIPSHASLFTGLHPLEHGCHGNIESKHPDIAGFPIPNPLSEESLTLAEILQQQGYSTVGISANPLVFNPSHRLGQGFYVQDDRRGPGSIYAYYQFRSPLHLFCALSGLWPQGIIHYRTADMMTANALQALKAAGDASIFLFVNYMDAHEPYNPPRTFAGEFSSNRHPQLERIELTVRQYVFKRLAFTRWVEYQLSQYDAEIMWLDSQLGYFFDRLKKMGLYDDALIVVTSDHGELFGENKYYGHKTPLYDPVVRVPLLIKYPSSRQTGRISTRVALTDVFPTILESCSLPVPESISARSLVPPAIDDLPVVGAFFSFDFGRHLAIYHGQYKYMHFQQQKPNELYNMLDTPAEMVNLLDAIPDVHEKISAMLDTWLGNHPAMFGDSAVETEISQRYIEELRALGYLK